MDGISLQFHISINRLTCLVIRFFYCIYKHIDYYFVLDCNTLIQTNNMEQIINKSVANIVK